MDFGTLALCHDNVPYSVPINFVNDENYLYFHGSVKGKKKNILEYNPYASFSIVEPFSFIPSYFTSNQACPATQFFKSIIIDGRIFTITNMEEKKIALSLMIKKMQKEDNYLTLDDNSYDCIFDKTWVYKLQIENLSAKFKFGQNLNKEKFDLIILNLEKSINDQDLETLKIMKELRNQLDSRALN